MERPLLSVKQSAKYVLANTPQLLQELLKILLSSSSEIANEAWKFLVTIPKDEELMKRLRTLEGNFESCLSISDRNNRAHIAYVLHGFYVLLHNEKSRDQTYIRKLRELRCFDFICELFKDNLLPKHTFIDVRCLYYCLGIMLLLWGDARTSLKELATKEKMWANVIDILKWVLSEEALDVNEIMEVCIEFLKRLLVLNRNLMLNSLVKDLFGTLFKLGKLIIYSIGLFKSDERVRCKVKIIILRIHTEEILRLDDRIKLESQLINIIIDNYTIASSTQYFETSEEIFVRSVEGSFNKESTDFALNLINTVSESIKALNYNPILLSGSMSLLYRLILKNVFINNKYTEPLFILLLNFTFDNFNPFDEPRSKALNLLGELAKRLKKFAILIDKLVTLHKVQQWRTEKFADWNIDCEVAEENVRDYVGLINMGATCYVNSVIQQLFMITSLRKNILGLNIMEDTPLYELQHLFGVLYKKKVRNYNAKNFYNSMQVDYGVQRDASEFLIELFDKLNVTLKRESRTLLCKQIRQFNNRSTV